MTAGPTGPTPPFIRPAAAAAVPEPPQYAEFDVSKKSTTGGAHEDALPVMPTWETAGSKKVLVEEEAVEMDQLRKPDASTAAGSSSSANGQNVPLMTGASAIPGPVSPMPSPDHRSPYSPPGATGAAGGYMGAGVADPYAANGRGYNNYNGGGAYGQSATSLGTDQGYGMAGAAMAGAGRRSPRDYNNGGYGQTPHAQDGYQDAYGQDQGYPAARPPMAGYNSYGSGRQGSYDSYNQPGGAAGYGRGQGRRSPPRGGPNMPGAGAYPQERMGRAPPPRAAEYGGAARTFSPAPLPQQQRQPTYEMPAEPVAATDNAGFDFGSGYSRPQQQGTPAQDYRTTTPAQDDGYGASRPARQGPGGGAGYPGYRPYNPQQQQQQQQQQGWSGL
jgi:hypothetical protein